MTMALLNSFTKKKEKKKKTVDENPKQSWAIFSKANIIEILYQKLQKMLPMALNGLLAIEAAMWLMVHHLLDHWLGHYYLQPVKERENKHTQKNALN